MAYLIHFHVAIGHLLFNVRAGIVNPNIDEISPVDGREFAEKSWTTTPPRGRLGVPLFPTLDAPVEACGPIHDLGDGDCVRLQEEDLADLPSRDLLKRLLIPMFFGAWTMGSAGSVILDKEEMTASGLTFSFLFADSLEEPDLLDPGIREVVGAGPSMVSLEPVPRTR